MCTHFETSIDTHVYQRSKHLSSRTSVYISAQDAAARLAKAALDKAAALAKAAAAAVLKAACKALAWTLDKVTSCARTDGRTDGLTD